MPGALTPSESGLDLLEIGIFQTMVHHGWQTQSEAEGTRRGAQVGRGWWGGQRGRRAQLPD